MSFVRSIAGESLPHTSYHFPDPDRINPILGIAGYTAADSRILKCAFARMDGDKLAQQQASVRRTNACIKVLEDDLLLPLRRLYFHSKITTETMDEDTERQVDTIIGQIFELASHRSINRDSSATDSRHIAQVDHEDFFKRVVNLASTRYKKEFVSLITYMMRKHSIVNSEDGARFVLWNEGCLAKVLALEICGQYIEDHELRRRE